MLDSLRYTFSAFRPSLIKADALARNFYKKLINNAWMCINARSYSRKLHCRWRVSIGESVKLGIRISLLLARYIRSFFFICRIIISGDFFRPPLSPPSLFSLVRSYIIKRPDSTRELLKAIPPTAILRTERNVINIQLRTVSKS